MTLQTDCLFQSPTVRRAYAAFWAGTIALGMSAFLLVEGPLAVPTQALFFAVLFPVILYPIIAGLLFKAPIEERGNRNG